jgi:DNA-binding NarL/FixJ family response regulator
MLPEGHTTVVVADVVPLVRAGIASALAPHGFTVVGEVDTARGLPTVLQATGAALAVVGAVADLAALDLVHLLRGADVPVPPRVVLLLGRVPRELLAELLGLDVDGLIPRAIAAAELPPRLHRVMAGERVIDPILLTEELPDDEEGPAALTAREREVLGLLSSGQSNREIASALYVSLPTVKTHLAHIYAKLGAKNRNEALGRAMALGLLT